MGNFSSYHKKATRTDTLHCRHKFDIFRISSSSPGVNHVYGPAARHWPGGKSVNEVFSMLHRSTEERLEPYHVKCTRRKLELHTDNFCKWKKYPFVLCYQCWRIILDIEDFINSYFMILATKNVCDRTFGHFKRKIKRTDCHVPAENWVEWV